MGDYRQERRLYMDGKKWCAVGFGFRNLAVDPAGFGDDPEAAVRDLDANMNIEDFVSGGYCRVCKEWVPSDERMDGCRDPGCPCQ